jgi:methylated-DNA-[protein]-cysteine S-methyltransferase
VRTMASRCAEIESDLVASAMGEATPAASRQVEVHLERCGSCRDEFARYRVIDREVATMRSEPAIEDDVARSREALRARLADVRSRILRYRVFATPFGHVAIGHSEQGVALVEYLDRGSRLDVQHLRRVADVEVVEGGRELLVFQQELGEYFEGRRDRLPWPLDLRLARSDFHRHVLETAAGIPYGGVVSYKGLAQQLGRPSAVRAVAQALRWNPLPIVIPCHRVVGASGALVGYAGGATTRKRRLLSIEGVPLARISHDYRVRREAMYVRAPGDTEYCLPTCPSVDPFPQGGVLFGSKARAEAAGYAPCTTCRPDLHPLVA